MEIVKMRIKGRTLGLAFLATIFSAGCSLFGAPESIGDRSTDPPDELFVIHSLAETLSSIELNDGGTFGPTQHDVRYLGAVPNDIDAVDEYLVITLSGQNELLILNETNLEPAKAIEFPVGSNPMESVHLYTPSIGTDSVGQKLIATTNFLTNTVRIVDLGDREWTEEPPWTEAVGDAPQALLTLPGSAADELRLLVANTAYSSARPGEGPYGRGTVSVLTFGIQSDASPGSIFLRSSETVDLEGNEFQAEEDAGLNPTAMIDLPSAGANGEVAVIGSGVNYGSGTSGSDDGTVVILDRDSLDPIDRIEVGGSPGSVVARTDSGGLTLYMASPAGIRSLRRDATGWEAEGRMEYTAESESGGHPFLSDIAILADTLFAADFANDRVLTFEIRSDLSLDQRSSRSVSQGPIELLVQSE